MKKNLLILFRILLAVYLICLCILCFGNFSGIPQIEEKILGFDPDKVVHFLMFFPFPILAWLAMERHPSGPWPALGLTLLLFLTGCAIAAGTEIGQHFLPWRTSDPKDFRADTLALALSAFIVFVKMLFSGIRSTRTGK